MEGGDKRRQHLLVVGRVRARVRLEADRAGPKSERTREGEEEDGEGEQSQEGGRQQRGDQNNRQDQGEEEDVDLQKSVLISKFYVFDGFLYLE